MPPLNLLRTVPRLSFLSHHQSKPLRTPRIPTRLYAQDSKREAIKEREKINTDADEYAQSSTDDTAARNEEAAFDPRITDPQEAKKKAGEGNRGNPLDVSPASPELSRGTEEEDGGGAGKKNK